MNVHTFDFDMYKFRCEHHRDGFLHAPELIASSRYRRWAMKVVRILAAQLLCVDGFLACLPALITLVLLVWSKRVTRASFGPEDYMLVIATVISIALTIQTNWAVAIEGEGNHIQHESLSQVGMVAKSLWANELLWSIANTLLRVSILLTSLRIFGHYYRRILRSLIALSLLYGLTIVLEAFLVCRPLSASWDPNAASSCGDEVVIFIVSEAIGLLIDIMILAFPLIWISTLQMTTLRKAKISIVFSLGGIVLVVSAFRVQALNDVNSTDITYSKCYLGLLSEIGTFMSIITCSLLSLMPVFMRTGVWARRFHSLITVFGRSSARRTRSRTLPTPAMEVSAYGGRTRSRHISWLGQATDQRRTSIINQVLNRDNIRESVRSTSRSRVRWIEDKVDTAAPITVEGKLEVQDEDEQKRDTSSLEMNTRLQTSAVGIPKPARAHIPNGLDVEG